MPGKNLSSRKLWLTVVGGALVSVLVFGPWMRDIARATRDTYESLEELLA